MRLGDGCDAKGSPFGALRAGPRSASGARGLFVVVASFLISSSDEKLRAKHHDALRTFAARIRTVCLCLRAPFRACTSAVAITSMPPVTQLS